MALLTTRTAAGAGMVSRRSKGRRFVRPTILAVSLLLLGSAWVVLATPGQKTDDPQPEPYGAAEPGDAMDIPVPRVGDKGLFKVAKLRTMQDGSSVVVEEVQAAAFQYLDDEQILYADGTLRWANAVLYQDGGEGAPIEKVFFEPGSGRIIARETWSGLNDAGYMESRRLLVYVDDAAQGVPAPLCWIRSQVQGTTLARGQELSLDRNCRIPGLPSAPAPTVFGMAARATLAHFASVRFVEADAPAPAEFWLTSGLAYPLRVEAPVGSGTEERFVLRLAAFDPGVTPIRNQASGVGDSFPAGWERPQRYGPADSALRPHPFLLSAALAWMKTDDGSQVARDDAHDHDIMAWDWNRNHPDAYVVRASFQEIRNYNWDRWVWDITLADGPGTVPIRVCPYLHVTYNGRLGPTVGLPTEDLAKYEHGFQPCPEEIPESVPPSLPPVMLSWPSIEARWRALATPNPGGPEPSFYGFEVRCEDWACRDLSVEYRFGISVGTASGFTQYMPCRCASIESGILEVAENGESRSFETMQIESSHPRLAGFGTIISPSEPPENGDVEGILDAVSVDEVPPQWSLYMAGVGLAAVVAGALYYLVEHLRAGGITGYTRLRKDDLLEHPARAMLVQLVETNPGIHLQEVLRRTGLPNGTALHHIRKLVDMGVVTEVAQKGYTCYFVKGQTDFKVMSTAPVLKSPVAMALLRTIAVRPGLSGQGLAAAVGSSPKVVSYHLQRMAGLGLVELTRQGKEIMVCATETGQAAAKHYHLAYTQLEPAPRVTPAVAVPAPSIPRPSLVPVE